LLCLQSWLRHFASLMSLYLVFCFAQPNQQYMFRIGSHNFRIARLIQFDLNRFYS
jgi:hypothetical protein